MRCRRLVWRDDESAGDGAAREAIVGEHGDGRLSHRRRRLAERYEPDATVSPIVLQRANERRSGGNGCDGRAVDLDEEDFRDGAIHNDIFVPWASRRLPRDRDRTRPAHSSEARDCHARA